MKAFDSESGGETGACNVADGRSALVAAQPLGARGEFSSRQEPLRWLQR